MRHVFVSELNPVSWSNFQNLRGFTMFSKEVQIEAVTMYLQGIPPYKIRKKFGIKGTDTIRNWVTNIKELGVYGLNNASQSKTNYQYSFKIKVIKWRLEHKASLPVTAKKFHIRTPATIWQWERALESGRLKSNKQRRKKIMTKQEDNKIKKLEEENELLRIKVAYLEKLEALAQEKKKLQTKTRR